MLLQMLFSSLFQAEPIRTLAAFHCKNFPKRGEEGCALFAVGEILGGGDDVAFVIDQHIVPFIGLLRKHLSTRRYY